MESTPLESFPSIQSSKYEFLFFLSIPLFHWHDSYIATMTTFSWVEILSDYIKFEQNYDPKPDFKYFQTILNLNFLQFDLLLSS